MNRAVDEANGCFCLPFSVWQYKNSSTHATVDEGSLEPNDSDDENLSVHKLSIAGVCRTDGLSIQPRTG